MTATSIIKSAFGWLVGSHNTSLTGTSDTLNSQYRNYFPRLETPKVFTTEAVDREVSQAAVLETQAKLAQIFHRARGTSIKSLNTLDRLSTESAIIYSDTALEVSGRTAKAQEKLLPQAVEIQLNNTRTNAFKRAYAQGLKPGA